MFPNHLDQIYLPWASMPLMTSFYHPQFHCSIGMEGGQIFGCTFSNVSKINDLSPLQLQKCTEGNMILKQKWSHMTWETLGKHSYDPRLQHV